MHAFQRLTPTVVFAGILAMAFIIGCKEEAPKAAGPAAPKDMALVEAGTFMMGNLTDCACGTSDELPAHQVTLTRSFHMGLTEITQKEWSDVMGANPSVVVGDDLPVTNVSWREAVDYCNRRSKREGLTPCYSGSGDSTACNFDADGYRLPTEAEWEYACRAGSKTDVHTGNVGTCVRTEVDSALNAAGWYTANSAGTIHPVGTKAVNAFGLFDMHGNVAEWCWDGVEWMQDGFPPYPSEPVTDPIADARTSNRVTRGGSAFNAAMWCRASARGCAHASDRARNLGFRVVRTAVPGR